jgi:hypothetical protein
MTGVKAPAAVLGASMVVTHAKGPHVTSLGASVAHKTLPFTGIALSVYLAIALGLILTGIVLRTAGRSKA